VLDLEPYNATLFLNKLKLAVLFSLFQASLAYGRTPFETLCTESALKKSWHSS
ncbi:hypothetical protein D5086_019598, partial [Populus alba]